MDEVADQPIRLTINEVLACFHREPDDSRWIGTADSQEYVALVTYLMARNTREYRYY